MVLLANLARKLPRNRIDETFIKSKIHHNRDSKSQMYQDVSKGVEFVRDVAGRSFARHNGDAVERVLQRGLHCFLKYLLEDVCAQTCGRWRK